MNEEALQDAFRLFASQGYNGDVNDFIKLVSTNQEALQDAHKIFSSEGYNGDINHFKSLIGVGQQPTQQQTTKIQPLTQQQPVKKKEPMASSSEGGLSGFAGLLIEGFSKKEQQRVERKKQEYKPTTALPWTDYNALGKGPIQDDVEGDDVWYKKVQQGRAEIEREKKLKELKKYENYQPEYITDEFGNKFKAMQPIAREEYLTQPLQKIEQKVKYEEEAKKIQDAAPEEIKSTLKYLDLSKEKGLTNFISDANYYFNDAGFEFKDAGSGYIEITSPDGEVNQFKYHFGGKQDIENTIGSINNLILKKSAKLKDVYGLDRMYKDENKKFATQYQIDSDFSMLAKEQESLAQQASTFLKRKQEAEAALKAVNELPMDKRTADYRNDKFQAEQNLKAIYKEAEDLQKKIDDIPIKQKNLEKALGKYNSKQEKQGTWVGGIYNSMLSFLDNTLAGSTDIFIDLKTKVIPLRTQLGSEEYEKRVRTYAAELGIDANKVLLPEEYMSKLTDPEKRGAVLDAKVLRENIDAKIRDDIRKKEKYGTEDELTYMEAMRNGFRTAFGDKNTTEQWEALTKKSFVGGAVLGAAEFVPTMFVPGAWVRRATTYASVNDMVNQEIENIPELRDISEAEKLYVKIPIGLVGAVLEEYGVKNIVQNTALVKSITGRALLKATGGMTPDAFKKIVSNEVSEMIADGTLKILGGAVMEFETGAAQQGVDIAVKNIYNASKGKKLFDTPDTVVDIAVDMAIGGAQESIGSVAITTPMVVATAYRKKEIAGIPAEFFDVFVESANDRNIEKGFIATLKNDITAGKITQKEAVDLLNNYRNSVGLLRSVPPELDNADKKKAMVLLSERKELENKTEGKDPALVKPIQERITQINEQLTKLTQDAIQKQAASEVSLQPETEPSKEMEAGGPEAGPQAAPQQGVLSPEESERKEELTTAIQNIETGATAVTIGEATMDIADAQAELDAIIQKEQATPEAQKQTTTDIFTAAPTKTRQAITFTSPDGIIVSLDGNEQMAAQLYDEAIATPEDQRSQQQNKIVEKMQPLVTAAAPAVEVTTTEVTPVAETTTTEAAPVQPAEQQFTEQDRARKQELTDALAKADKRRKNITVGETVMPKADVKAELDALNQKELSSQQPVTAPVETAPKTTVDILKATDSETKKTIIVKDNEGNDITLDGNEDVVNDLYEDAVATPTEQRTEQQNNIIEKVEQMLNDQAQAFLNSIETGVANEQDSVNATDTARIDEIKSKYENSGDKNKVKIIDKVKKAIRTLKSIFPDFDIIIHDSKESYEAEMDRIGSDKNSKGNFAYIVNEKGNVYGGRIDINLSNADARTVAHEVAHAILLKAFGDNSALFKNFRDKISKVLSESSNKALMDFANQYEGDVSFEEYLVELTAALSNEEGSLNPTTLMKIATLINNIISNLTNGFLKPFENVKNTKDVIEFFDTISKTIREGGSIDIEKLDVIERLNNQQAYSEGIAIEVSDPKEFTATPISKRKIADYKDTDKFEILETAKIPTKTLTEKVREYGGRVIIITSDATGYGIDSEGNLILGGPGFASNKKNVDDGIGFASLNVGTVKSTYTMAEKSYGKNKTLVLIMVQPPHTTINNSYGTNYIIRGLIEIGKRSKEELSKTIDSIKGFVSKSKAVQKEFKSESKKADKLRSTQEALFNVLDKIKDAKNKEDIVNEYLQVTTFNIRKEIGLGILSPNKDTKTNKKTTYSKLSFNEIGYTIYDFLKEYGDKTILDNDLILNNKGGYVVAGFELDVLDTDKRDALISETQSKGIVHPLFNAKLPGTNHFVLDGLYSVNDNFAQYAKPDKEIDYSKTSKEEINKLIRENLKEDKFYTIPSREKPLSERTYTDLKAEGKSLLKFKILGEGKLKDKKPDVATKVSKGEGFAPVEGAAKKMAEAKFKPKVISKQQKNKIDTKPAEEIVAKGRANGVADSVIRVALKMKGFSDEVIAQVMGTEAKGKITVSEKTLPGYDKLMNRIAGVIDRSRKRKLPDEKIMENVINNVEANSPEYANATNQQREQIIRDIRAMFGKKEKKTPTAEKIVGKPKPKKVTVNEMTALKDQIRLEARAAREAKGDMNTKRKMLTAAINEMKKKGSISVRQAKALINRVNSVNLDNPVMVERLLTYAEKVFNDADYADKLNKANDLQSKIKQLSRNKEKFGNLTPFAAEFAKIDPAMVENIDEYIEMASNVKEGVQGSKIVRGNVVPADMVDVGKTMEYVNKMMAAQEETIRKNTAERLQELMGVDVSELTYDQMMELLNLSEDEKVDKYKEGIIRNFIDKMFNTYSTIINDMFETGIDPFSDPDNPTTVEFKESDKKIVEEFMDMDLKLLDAKEALRAADALNNFIVNKSIAGMEGVLGTYRGRKNVKEVNTKGVRSQEIKMYFSPAIGRLFYEQFASVPLFFERLFKGFKVGQYVREKMGINSLINHKAEALEAVNKIITKYVSQFSKMKPNKKSFQDMYNIIERGIIGDLAKTIVGDEKQVAAEFNRRKKLIEESIEILNKGGTKKETEAAKVIKEVYDKIARDANTIAEVKEKADPINVEAVQFWVDQWARLYDQFADVALSVYNKVLDKNVNYVPDRYGFLERSEKGKKDTDGTESLFFANSNIENFYKKEAGSLMKSAPPNSLFDKDGNASMYVNLSFDTNNANALLEALIDIKTAADIRQIQAFKNSPEFENIIRSGKDASLVKDRIATLIRNIRNKRVVTDKVFRDVTRKLDRIAALGTALALAGPTQAITQTLPVAVNTFINSGGRLNLSVLHNKAVNAFMNNSGMGIANRGNDATTELETLNQKLEAAATSKTEAALRAVENVNRKYLEIFLSNFDVMIARASWITYYEKSLKKQNKLPKQGIDYSNHEMNKEAAQYAQDMVDRQQNISDKDLAGKLYNSDNPGKQFLVKIVMPLTTFRMNQTTRFSNDLAVLSSKTASNEDKKTAAFSLGGFAAEMATFRLAKLYIGYYVFYSLAQFIRGEEDDEEEKKKKWNNMLKGATTSVVTDVLSPIPQADDLTKLVISTILDKTQELAGVDKEQRYNIFTEKKKTLIESIFSDLGLLGIAADKITKLSDNIQLGITGKFTDDYGNEKTIKEKDRKLLSNPYYIALGITTTLGINPFSPETSNIMNSIVKSAKNDAMTSKQLETYEETGRDKGEQKAYAEERKEDKKEALNGFKSEKQFKERDPEGYMRAIKDGSIYEYRERERKRFEEKHKDEPFRGLSEERFRKLYPKEWKMFYGPGTDYFKSQRTPEALKKKQEERRRKYKLEIEEKKAESKRRREGSLGKKWIIF